MSSNIESIIQHFTTESLKILYLDCLSKNDILRANLIVDIIDIYDEIKNFQNLLNIVIEKIRINTNLMLQYQDYIRTKVIEYDYNLDLVKNLEEYKQFHKIKKDLNTYNEEYKEYDDYLSSLRVELQDNIKKDLAFLMFNYLNKKE